MTMTQDVLTERIPNPREHLYIACSTRCNLRCVICPYRKNVLDRQIMTNELFTDVVQQACELGFDAFGLTPLVGEVLTDPEFAWKLSWLERCPAVKSYSLTTNFTLADESLFARLPQLRKLRAISISVYGHGECDFVEVTGSDRYTWQRLLANLSRLSDCLPPAPAKTMVRIRSTGPVAQEQLAPELNTVLTALAAKHVSIGFPRHYYNWGGLVGEDEIDGGAVPFKPSPSARVGACAMIFYKTIVLPDGRVNACACRDAAATLVIGDLRHQRLNEIYSTKNPVYRRLIEDQSQGVFGAVCAGCNMYRSVFSTHVTYEIHRKPFVSLADFFERF
jgi:hypothetical protein